MCESLTEIELDLSKPEYYLNRELSWLEFNDRVLEEAQDKTNPIMERLKFLAITASNLDEFFMVRVSGIMDQIEANFTGREASGMSPQEQMEAISDRIHRMIYKQYNCLNRSLFLTLQKENIFFPEISAIIDEQRKFVDSYFDTVLFPILTPMAIDQSRPFPLLSNKSLNVITKLEDSYDEIYAVIQVPSVISRYILLPQDDLSQKTEIIFIEDIIKLNCDKLFNGYTVVDSYTFRITRNSDLSIDEEDTADLLIEIEQSIKKRKWGEPVRLEIEKSIEKPMRNFLKKMLELDERDVYDILGPIDLTCFMKISGLEGFDYLRNKPIEPVPSISFIDRDVFEAISQKDILLHHPYESFDAVLKFIDTAANDPQVLAIKQTLYRVSGNSPIVHSLIKAAENSKQVTVLVELKARFDEENNILWAKKLEKAGCHVVYGLVGLKTHCKICLVVRKEEDGIKRYFHMGTGNYNDSTAKIYTDLGYFSCKESVGQDISALFNVLTGYSVNLNWNKISVAPISLKNLFISKIRKEAENAAMGKPAEIIAKMNSLVDTTIIQELYKASMAGVSIKLIVRGICCLKPGVEKISENISVVSIVDKFLEHSRIYYFHNNGNNDVYLSSADWMPRNLDRRVEVAFPVTDDDLKKEVLDILHITLADSEKLREQQPDGTYIRADRRKKDHLRSQDKFIEIHKNRYTKFIEIPIEEKLKPILSNDKKDD